MKVKAPQNRAEKYVIRYDVMYLIATMIVPGTLTSVSVDDIEGETSVWESTSVLQQYYRHVLAMRTSFLRRKSVSQ